MKSRTISYRPDVDGLRALAIILVLGFHLYPNHLTGGFVGVDVFFVISGYLITSIINKRLWEQRFSLLDFYQSRILRLFPALILVSITVVILGWFKLVPNDYARLGRHLIATFGFHENLVLRKESGYFDSELYLKPLAHIWSLSIEEQFYFLFPILLMGLFKLQRLKWPILLIFGIASFLVCLMASKTNPQEAYLMPWMRVWEFLAGALLALYPFPTPKPDALAANLLSVSGIVLIIGSALRLSPSSTFPGVNALPIVLGTAMMIGTNSSCFVNRVLLGNRLMAGIGLISYPLYLWHWPLVSFLRFWKGTFVDSWLILTSGFISIILATMTYLFVERPLWAWGSRTQKTRFLFSAGVVLLILGFIISRLHGIPSRYPPLPSGLIPANFSFPPEWRFGKCLLFRTQGPEDFDQECSHRGHGERPGVGQANHVLWGDSFAAHLYPGLKEKIQDSQTLVQWTAVACAPFLASAESHPNCQRVNQFVIGYLEKNPGTEVFLAANWSGAFRDLQLDALRATLDKLKSIGTRNVVLFGPPPLWIKPLPTLIIEWSSKHPNEPLPERLSEHAAGFTEELDERLHQLANEYQIGYVSILHELCNSDGCLALIDHSLTSVDSGHLTVAGSRAAVKKH